MIQSPTADDASDIPVRIRLYGRAHRRDGEGPIEQRRADRFAMNHDFHYESLTPIAICSRPAVSAEQVLPQHQFPRLHDLASSGALLAFTPSLLQTTRIHASHDLKELCS